MNDDYENPFNCSPIDESVPKVQILVVDDDSSYLDFFTGFLNMLNYQVTPARDPFEALNILQMKVVSFDCVITDICMPLMNGVVLQQKIEDDFSIPVVLMSEVSDKQKLAVETGLQEGAMVMSKPPVVDQVQNLWRYILIRLKTKNNFKGKKPIKGQSVNIKLKELNGSNGNEDPSNIDTRKRAKAKLVWTPALHNRFLDAIKAIGYDRAVPKNIMEHMNVTGLTRQHISSHLQKYRIYMKRIYDACLKIEECGVPFDWNQMMSSLTWKEFPDLVHNSYLLNYATAMFMKEIEEDKNRTRFKRRRTFTQFGQINGMPMLGNGTNISGYGIGLSLSLTPPSSQGLGTLYTPYRPIASISSNGTIGATSGVGSLYKPYRPIASRVTPTTSNGTIGVDGLYTPYRPIASRVTPITSSGTIGATSGGVGSLYKPYRPIASRVTPTTSNGTIGATSGVDSFYTPYRPISPLVTPTLSNGTIGATSGVGSLYTPYRPIAPLVSPIPSNGITIGANYHDIIGNRMRNNNLPWYVLESNAPNVGGYINNNGTGTQPQAMMTQGPFGYSGLHGGDPSNGMAMANYRALFATPYQGIGSQHQFDGNNVPYFPGGIHNFTNDNNMMQQPSVGNMPSIFGVANSQLNYVPTDMNQHFGTNFMPHTTPVPAAMPSYVASSSTDPTTTRLSNFGSRPNFTLPNSFVSPMGEFFNLSQQPFSQIATMINLSKGATTPLGAVWNHAAAQSSSDEASNGPLPLANLSDFAQQPDPATDVVDISDNVPNSVDEQPQPTSGVVADTLLSVEQQPQPIVAAAMSNMPNSVAQQPRVVSDNSDSLSNTSTGNQNVVAFTEQLAVGNQESNGSSASNDQQAQEMEGYGFNSGTSNHLQDWLSDVYGNDHSMDPMDAVAAYLNTDLQIDGGNDPWLGEY